MNSKHKKVNKLVSLRDSSEILHYDDLSKANLLNKYFSSVFTKNQYTDDVINNDSGICIGSFCFNENHIKILIEKLNICKAAGPDGIHAKVIKECSCIFPHIFNTIFHISLREGKIPQQWKEANVRALQKRK